jgi:hypothetical protein
MTAKDEKKRPAQRGILRSPWLWFIFSIALLAAVAIAVLPQAIRHGIKRAFVASGAKGATVEDVEFNPFTRTLVMHELRVDLGAPLALRAREVSVRFDWAPLWWGNQYLRFRKYYPAPTHIYLKVVSLKQKNRAHL